MKRQLSPSALDAIMNTLPGQVSKGQYEVHVLEEPATEYGSLSHLEIIRKGIPYDTLEIIGEYSEMPIRQVLEILDIPQTTYNKKKRERGRLSTRDSELVLAIAELLDYGRSVFDGDDKKFKRWLKKPNTSLGGFIPESLFDTFAGLQQVRGALERLDYGILA